MTPSLDDDYLDRGKRTVLLLDKHAVSALDLYELEGKFMLRTGDSEEEARVLIQDADVEIMLGLVHRIVSAVGYECEKPRKKAETRIGQLLDETAARWPNVTVQIRELRKEGDAAWARGQKGLSTDLHQEARSLEEKTRAERVDLHFPDLTNAVPLTKCVCGKTDPQGIGHRCAIRELHACLTELAKGLEADAPRGSFTDDSAQEVLKRLKAMLP